MADIKEMAANEQKKKARPTACPECNFPFLHDVVPHVPSVCLLHGVPLAGRAGANARPVCRGLSHLPACMQVLRVCVFLQDFCLRWRTLVLRGCVFHKPVLYGLSGTNVYRHKPS